MVVVEDELVVDDGGGGSATADDSVVGVVTVWLGTAESESPPVVLQADSTTTPNAKRTSREGDRPAPVRSRPMAKERDLSLPGGLSLGQMTKAYLARGLVAGVVVGFMLGLLNAVASGFNTDASFLSLVGRFFWTLLWSVVGGALGGITLTAVLNGLRRAVSSDRWNSPLIRGMGAVSGVLMGLIFARSLFLAAVGGLAGYLWSWPVPGTPEALEAGI